jgi:Ca2+-binding EF-hand superfamily protein
MLSGTSDAGRVDFHEFLDIITTRVFEPDTEDEIKRAFEMLDLDSSERVSKENLMKVIEDL